MRSESVYCGGDSGDRPEDYISGRRFPVLLGDTFEDGRYRVFNKLGQGGYGSVWAAHDNVMEYNVALKVVSLKYNRHEIDILRHLRSSPTADKYRDHPGRSFIGLPLNDFPVGDTHWCLVFEFLGQSLEDRVMEFNHRQVPLMVAIRIGHQILLGLDYLWKCGIAHGDLYPNNICFTAHQASYSSEEEAFEGRKPHACPVTRKDGHDLDTSVPAHLVQADSVRGDEDEIRIIDFGCAFFHDEPPPRQHTPWHYRAPEAVYGQPLDCSIDMWGFGSLVFEILTGESFMDNWWPSQTTILKALKICLGPPPAEWLASLADVLVNTIEEAQSCGDTIYDLIVDEYYKNDHDATKKPLCKLEEVHLQLMGQLLTQILRYCPQSRPTPEQALQNLERWGIFEKPYQPDLLRLDKKFQSLPSNPGKSADSVADAGSSPTASDDSRTDESRTSEPDTKPTPLSSTLDDIVNTSMADAMLPARSDSEADLKSQHDEKSRSLTWGVSSASRYEEILRFIYRLVVDVKMAYREGWRNGA